LALQWGGSTYPWKSGRVIALFVVFGVLTIMFIAVQIWKQDRGTVPPRILKQRRYSCRLLFYCSLMLEPSIWAGAWFAFFQGATFFLFVFYVSYHLSMSKLLS
jgi:hypothetical protein